MNLDASFVLYFLLIPNLIITLIFYAYGRKVIQVGLVDALVCFVVGLVPLLNILFIFFYCWLKGYQQTYSD